MEKEHVTNENRKVSKVFPWFLCALSFIVQFIGMGFYRGFGSIYVALQNEFDENDAVLAWIGSLAFTVTFMITPLTFKTYDYFGYRITMFIGGALVGISLFLSSFATNAYILFITYGIFMALGQSLCCYASLLILPLYFSKNWSLAHGIAMCGSSLGGMAWSPLLGHVLSKYGFSKGIRLASLSSLILVVSSVFYKKPSKKDDFAGQLESHGAKGDNATTQKKGLLYLTKNKAFMTFTVANLLINFGLFIPYVHLVRLAMDLGISHSKAIFLPGCMSMAQTVGKLAAGKFTSMPRINKLVLYQILLVLNCLSTTFVPALTTYNGLVIYAIIFGLAESGTSTMNMVLVRNLTAKDELARAYSFFLTLCCISFLAGPPLAGFLYDLSGNYSLAFFVSGGTSATAACLIFLVQFFKSQRDIELGRSKYKEKILEGEWMMERNNDSKQSDSVAASITKSSTRDQSLESLGHMDVEIEPNKAMEHILKMRRNDETSTLQTTKFHQNLLLTKCSQDFVNPNTAKSMLEKTLVLADSKELEELLKRETNI